MAVYRYQCISVGWWRGKIKRWNTTFHAADPGLTTTIFNHLQAACYPNPGDANGACSGGVASIAVYNSTGGAPISNTIYFDWQTPTTWKPFLGTAWASVPETTPIDASGESALVVVGTLGGLSSSGKPRSTRKYIHAVPSRVAAAFSDPDISSADQATLAAQFTIPIMLSPSGQAPLSVAVEPYYGNHQRVRGRRRTVTQVAAQSFSAGVVAGAASGGGQPAQFQ